MQRRGARACDRDRRLSHRKQRRSAVNRTKPDDTAPHCDRWPPFRRAYLLCSRPPQLGGRRRWMLTEKHVLHSRFKSCWLLARWSR